MMLMLMLMLPTTGGATAAAACCCCKVATAVLCCHHSPADAATGAVRAPSLPALNRASPGRPLLRARPAQDTLPLIRRHFTPEEVRPTAKKISKAYGLLDMGEKEGNLSLLGMGKDIEERGRGAVLGWRSWARRGRGEQGSPLPQPAVLLDARSTWPVQAEGAYRLHLLP